MNDDKKQLEGSINRDRFKKLHKTEMDSSFYALDVDFALISKGKQRGRSPEELPVIVAILDFKMPNDDLTFSEVLCYNRFIERNIPVYIIECETVDFVDVPTSDHKFTIKEYLGGDYKPSYVPYDSQMIKESVGWGGLEKWEKEVRSERKQERRKRYEELKNVSGDSIDGGSISDYALLSTIKEAVKSRPSLIDELLG